MNRGIQGYGEEGEVITVEKECRLVCRVVS